jgi:hypothetical protein
MFSSKTPSVFGTVIIIAGDVLVDLLLEHRGVERPPGVDLSSFTS